MKIAEQETSSPLAERSVLFVAGVEEAPLRYRVYLPAEALNLVDVKTQIYFHSAPELEVADAKAELIVLHRVKASKRILELISSARGRGVRTLFDVDDLIFDPENTGNIPWLRFQPPDQAAAFIRDISRYRSAIEACDGLIGSTQTLCDEAERLIGIPTRYFPNGVGVRLAYLSERALNQPKNKKSLRLGYLSGTKTHQLDFEFIEPAVIQALEKFNDAELWLVGNIETSRHLKRFGDRVKQLRIQPWQHLPLLTRQLDVNLAPLTLDNVFNETKSAIKWLEAGLVCTPTIASPTQPYRDAITHGRNGLLATSTADWYECLAAFLNDADLRERVGKQAREDALTNFNPEAQGKRYLKILEWATQLDRSPSVHSFPEIDDGFVKPHALEPYDMTLVTQRTDPKVPTMDLSIAEPLEFELSLCGAQQVRLDLLFATYGGPGGGGEVVIKDSAGELINATVPASQIAEGTWASFDFNLSAPTNHATAYVKLKTPSQGRRSRIALWADLSGTHLFGSKLAIGSPCVRIWICEGDQIAMLPDGSVANIGSYDTLMARFRLAKYLFHVNGWEAMTKRTGEFLVRRVRAKLTS